MSGLGRIPELVRRTVSGALAHDSLHLAQSAAYSAIVALFPALIVMAAMLSWVPVFAPVQTQIGAFFDQVLPGNVFPLLTQYFGSSSAAPHTARVLLAASVVSVTGASSVIATLMEGLRRAQDLPNDCWTFWQRRMRALLLVPLSFIPLALATGLVMFGELITQWLAYSMYTAMKPLFYALTLVVRWSLALVAVTAVTALLYYLGTPPAQNQAAEARFVLSSRRVHDLRRGFARTFPGAVAATLMWFATTLGFGWYVTRFANYNQVYGPLGAGIALLFWLYIMFLSVLSGAEFNAQFGRSQAAAETAGTDTSAPNAVG